MSEHRPEQRAEDVESEMARQADEMEHELEQLDEDIHAAQVAAAHRPEAESGFVGDVAGDWEDEATGAQQGEDPQDTERPKAPEAHDREGSTEA